MKAPTVSICRCEPHDDTDSADCCQRWECSNLSLARPAPIRLDHQPEQGAHRHHHPSPPGASCATDTHSSIGM